MELVQPIRDLVQLEKMKDVLRKSSYRDYFLFYMGINTGLRISDLLPLKVSDIKAKTHLKLRETKTGKNKMLKINPQVIDEFIHYVEHNNLQDHDYLFPSRKGGKPINRMQAYRILNNAASQVGIDYEIGTHTLRKTFGYHHYQRKKDVALLQEIFNHSSPSVTLRYIGINQDIMDESMDNFVL